MTGCENASLPTAFESRDSLPLFVNITIISEFLHLLTPSSTHRSSVDQQNICRPRSWVQRTFKMTLGYSKWDKLGLSDASDNEEQQEQRQPKMSSKAGCDHFNLFDLMKRRMRENAERYSRLQHHPQVRLIASAN
jgi:hypothetical protein